MIHLTDSNNRLSFVSFVSDGNFVCWTLQHQCDLRGVKIPCKCVLPNSGVGHLRFGTLAFSCPSANRCSNTVLFIHCRSFKYHLKAQHVFVC